MNNQDIEVHMSKQNAYKEISGKLAQAKALVRECEKIADETGEAFSWTLGGDMGGIYTPTNQVKIQALAKLTEAEKEALDLQDETVEPGSWNSSSNNC